MNEYLEYFKDHGLWLVFVMAIIIEYFFINRWGNINVITWILLSMIGWEISSLSKRK